MTERRPLPPAIEEQRLIAVMRRLGTARVQQIAPILHDAGIGVMEVTLDGNQQQVVAYSGGRILGPAAEPQVRREARQLDQGDAMIYRPGVRWLALDQPSAADGECR